MTILWILTVWVLLDRVLRCLTSWLEYCEARELDRLEWLERDRDECMEAGSGLAGPCPVGFGAGRRRRS